MFFFFCLTQNHRDLTFSTRWDEILQSGIGFWLQLHSNKMTIFEVIVITKITLYLVLDVRPVEETLPCC